VHEPHAHRANFRAAPSERTEYPAAGAFAETEHPSLSGDDSIADDEDLASE